MKNSDNISTCLGSLDFAINNMTISISMTKDPRQVHLLLMTCLKMQTILKILNLTLKIDNKFWKYTKIFL